MLCLETKNNLEEKKGGRKRKGFSTKKTAIIMSFQTVFFLSLSIKMGVAMNGFVCERQFDREHMWLNDFFGNEKCDNITK